MARLANVALSGRGILVFHILLHLTGSPLFEEENMRQRMLISLKIHFSIFVKALLMFHNYATNLTLTVIIITNYNYNH